MILKAVTGIMMFAASQATFADDAIETRPTRPARPSTLEGEVWRLGQRPNFPQIQLAFFRMQSEKQAIGRRQKPWPEELRRDVRKQTLGSEPPATVLRQEYRESLQKANLQSAEQMRKLSEETKTTMEESRSKTE